MLAHATYKLASIHNAELGGCQDVAMLLIMCSALVLVSCAIVKVL